MPFVMVSIKTWEKKMANLTTTLQKLMKESKKRKHTSIFKERVAKLTKKLEKGSTKYSTKGAESEEDEKASIYHEASGEEEESKKGYKPKRDWSLKTTNVE